MMSERNSESSEGPQLYQIFGLNTPRVKDKIFQRRIKQLKEDLKTCMKNNSVSRGMPATDALEYFARRDITGRPLIEAAEIFQKIATIYQLKATSEPDSRRRMFFLIYACALGAAAKERLNQVHREVRFGKWEEKSFHPVRATDTSDTTKVSTTSKEDDKLQVDRANSLSFKVESTERTELRISEAEEFLQKIEKDIQTYAGVVSTRNLGEFSTKMYEKVEKMRANRWDYKDEYDTSELNIARVRKVMTETAEEFISIMKDISDFSIDLLGRPPCDFAHLGMGSLAREDVTPYSDFENLILLEDGEHVENVYEYFRWYSVIFQCIVIRFGESPLRSFAIPEFNDFNTGGEKNWLWDDVISPGIRFDSIHPIASKVPLGSLETEKQKFDNFLKPKLKEEYFQLLSSMAGLFLDNSLEQELIKPLSQMAKLIFDHINLANERTKQLFLDKLNDLEASVHTDIQRLQQQVFGVHERTANLGFREKVALVKIRDVKVLLLGDGFCFDESGKNSVLKAVLQIANSLREKQIEMKTGWHVREVLVFSRFVAGNEKLHEKFQSIKFDKMSSLSKAYYANKIKDVFKDFRRYFPKIDLTKPHKRHCESKQLRPPDEFALEDQLDMNFKHGSKDIFHRLLCCFLSAVGRECGVYHGSLFEFVEKLNAIGYFSDEAKTNLEFLIASIYAWRDAIYASLGGQEDYFFGIEESVITNAMLLKPYTFRPDFQKMCSILVECRDVLRRYLTQDDYSLSLKDALSKSGLTSADRESVQDACDLFGFNKTDVTTCNNTASAFSLFGCMYFAVVAKRAAPYLVRKGTECALASEGPMHILQSTRDNVFTRAVNIPHASQSASNSVTVQYPSSRGPLNIQIPQELFSRNEFTAIHIPNDELVGLPGVAAHMPPTQPGVIQLTPEMLTGNKITMIRLPQAETSQSQIEVNSYLPEELKSNPEFGAALEQIKELFKGLQPSPAFSKNAIFSNMIAQETMVKTDEERRAKCDDLAKSVLRSHKKEELTNELRDFFNGQDKSVGSVLNERVSDSSQEAKEPPSAFAVNADIGEESQLEKAERYKKTIKHLLAKTATDGSLQALMTANFTDMARNLMGQEMINAMGPQNPIILFGSKLLVPNILFPSLVDKEKRLLLLSEFRAHHIGFDEFLTEQEKINRFLIDNEGEEGKGEDIMDDIFEFASLAIEHDASKEMTEKCRAKCSEVLAKLSCLGFYDESVFNTALQAFNHMVQDCEFALRKLENLQLPEEQ